VAGVTAIPLTVALADPAAATPSIDIELSLRANYDEQVESSATDAVEVATPAWEAASDPDLGEQDPWRRAREPERDNHVWLGPDPASQADERLVSPPLQVSANRPFAIRLDHRYRFEQSADPFGGGDEVTSWDGAVIEISDDDGATWRDVAELADPGYTGAIGVESGNPLAGRDGFVGESPGYPAFTSVAIDLGEQLADRTVRVRFRIGADAAVGDAGWELDNIAFEGITNTPFGALQEDSCGDEPDAGPEGDPAADDGTGSCGCGTVEPAGAGALLWVVVGGLLLRRRRRRSI
jgi:MYXO-CTERM domain-containing protein